MYIIRPNSNIQGTFSEKNILDAYQLNILNNVTFMQKISTKTAPSMFHSHFERPSHSYPTNVSESNYSLPAHNLRKSKFRISIRQLLEKSLETMSLFKSKVENKLLV